MKINRLAIAVAAALTSTCALAGVPTNENTKTQGMGNYTFGVSDQSVWASDGPSSTDINWQLSSAQWDSVFGRPPRARLGVGGILSECVLGVCASFGAAAGLQLEAYVLPYVDLHFDPGTFDATANFAPTASYQFEGLGTDRFSIDTSSGLNAGASSLSIDAPRFTLETGLNIETNLSLFAEACFVDCFLDEKYNIPGTNVDFDIDLLRIDTFTGEFAHLNLDPSNLSLDTFAQVVSGDADVSDLFYKQITAEEVAREVQRQADKRDQDGVVTTIENLLEIDTGPINIALSNPFTENVNGSFDGTSFNASLGGDLLDVSLDIDEVIGYAFGLPSGGTLAFDEGPVSAQLTIGDINAGPTIDLIQDVSVTPDLMVNMQFDNEVFIAGRIGKQTSYYGSWENLPEFALLADSNILRDGETREDKTVTATTEFSLNATVNNRTYLDVGAQVSGELLSASIAIQDFDALSIGPLLSFREEASLFEVDIYNNQFSVNQWSGLDENGLQTGVRTFAGTDLTFNGFGEIVFQARDWGGQNADDGFFSQDDRIDQSLSVNELIHYEAEQRGYAWIQDSTLQNRLNHEYTVDQEQAGHIMRDGKLTVDANRTMIIEADASVELGKDNNYAIRNVFEEAADTRELGLVNHGDLQVYGELYSNAGTQNENYVFRNAADGQIEVGASGWLKFDGNLQNQGEIVNYGRIENTAEASWSTGSIENKVGGEVDIYGSFVMQNDPAKSNQYQNDGTLNINRGGDLELTSAAGRGELVNTGDIKISRGGELSLTRTSANARTSLTNYGSVENSGYVLNTAGQSITNGTRATAQGPELLAAMTTWQNTRDEINRLYEGEANPNNYVELYQDMETISQINRQAKLYWHDNPFENEETYAATSNYLNEIRKTGGTLDQAYAAIQTQVEDLKSQGFGVWENKRDSLLVNQGEFNNNAVVVNNVGADFYNEGLLNNNGYISNTGNLVSHSSTGIINTGVLENGTDAVGFAGISTMVSLDYIDNSGTVSNKDTFTNYGELNNENITPESNAKVINSGLISNVGSFNNAAHFENNSGAQTDNYGTITNDGTIDNHGFINNGIDNASASVVNDNSAVKAEALAFHQTSQELNVQNLELTKLTTMFDNESARQSANGFKGELTGETANEFAIHLYEKYLVSDQAYGYGPQVGSLEENREFIRDWVNERSQLSNSQKDACNSNILECYKVYYGDRSRLGMEAIDYVLGGYNTGIQAYSQYADSGLERNNGGGMGNSGDDQNRFEWTMLMMLGEEGLNVGSVLDLQAMENLFEDDLNPQDAARLFKSNYFGYGDDDNFGEGNISGIEAIYARWIDEAFLETSFGYNRYGSDFSFNDINSPNRNSLSFDLVSIYQDLTGVISEITALNTTLNSLNIDLANVTSLTANLTNNGTINNFGVINNRATLNNSIDANVNNDGVLINAQGATINNDGEILTDNNGILLSEGTLNNNGLLEVKSGTMMNNGVINNSGQIVLSAVYDPLNLDNNGQTSVERSLFTNNGTLFNNADGLIQIGINTFQAASDNTEKAFNYFESTFENYGEIVNLGAIVVNDILFNAGIIENQAGSRFENNGLLNNSQTGVITFAQSASLGGSVINNGIIVMSDEELLTMTSGVAGSGIFYGDTMLSGANVRPGNSAGLLTFAGDLGLENTSWFMEIFGDNRGISFDAIDVVGDLSLFDMNITFDIESYIDFDAVIDFEFNFMHVVGDLLDRNGNTMTDLTSWFTVTDNWFGRWYQQNDGWWLGFEYTANRDTYNAQYPPSADFGPKEIPEPRIIMLFLFGLAFLVLSRKEPAPMRKK